MLTKRDYMRQQGRNFPCQKKSLPLPCGNNSAFYHPMTSPLCGAFYVSETKEELHKAVKNNSYEGNRDGFILLEDSK